MSVVLEADVLIDDLDAFLVDPNHRARLSGKINIAGTGSFQAQGKVELFVIGDKPGQRLMRYQADFAIGAAQCELSGTKHVQHATWLYVWRDVTTLYTSLWQLAATPAVIGAGTLKLSLWQGIRLFFSLRGGGAQGLSGLTAVLRFIRFFIAETFLQAIGWPR